MNILADQPASHPTAADVIAAARAALVERGWTQNGYVDHVSGGLCVVAALRFVVGLDPTPAAEEMPVELRAALEELELELTGTRDVFGPVALLTAWNDDVDGVDQVLALLDTVLADLAARPVVSP